MIYSVEAFLTLACLDSASSTIFDSLEYELYDIRELLDPFEGIVRSTNQILVNDGRAWSCTPKPYHTTCLWKEFGDAILVHYCLPNLKLKCSSYGHSKKPRRGKMCTSLHSHSSKEHPQRASLILRCSKGVQKLPNKNKNCDRKLSHLIFLSRIFVEVLSTLMINVDEKGHSNK